MRGFRVLRVASLAGLVLLATCDDQQQLFDPTAPTFEIMDAAHDVAANPNFFFLPPLVPDPSGHEDFDPQGFDGQQSPEVEICALGVDGCETSVITYTTTTGHGSEVVRVIAEEQHYIVNWHTDEFGLDTTVTYRINVTVEGTLLGYADVDVVSSGKEFKNVDTDHYIALKDGRTLPIKFRIEHGAVHVVDAAGGTVTAVDGAVTLDIPAGALGEPVGLTIIPKSDNLSDPKVVPGTAFDFGPDGLAFAEAATLTIMYDEAELPPGADETLLFIYKLVDDAWYVVAGSSTDEIANTVTALIDGFSYYSVRRFYEPAPPKFTVNSTADPGIGVCDLTECTLREAIASANTVPTHNNIVFDIPGGGPHTIRPLTPLPTITDPVTIDGYTQPGATANAAGPGSGGDAVLMIELDGSALWLKPALRIEGGHSLVRGLVVNRFRQGIVLASSGNVVAGNYVGTDVTGTQALGNLIGVHILPKKSYVSDGGFSVLVDSVPADSNVVGGTNPAARNIISASQQPQPDSFPSGTGVAIQEASQNSVVGNLIGTDVTGAAALGNSSNGVFVGGGIANAIGGASTEARNVISGNGRGVYTAGGSEGTSIRGNYVGTDISGILPLGNTGNVEVSGLRDTVANNVIAASHGSGIEVSSHEGTVVDNYVGTDLSGGVNLGNRGGGIVITGQDNSVRGNVIANNGSLLYLRPGIGIYYGATRNSVFENSIRANRGLGIDLAPTRPGPFDDPDGVTANDVADVDAGPNNLQNFPVLTSAQASTSDVSIAGILHSEPSKAYHVEFFASAECDPSGYGEGETFIDATSVVTDAGGDAIFSVAFAQAVSVGHVMTATATAPDGSTSEFSACVEVTWSPTLTASLAFTSNRDGDYEIYITDGVVEQQITDNTVDDRYPDWLGDQILFIRDGDIYLVSASGGAATNLTNTPAVNELVPNWSPDGTSIAYIRETGGGTGEYDIFVMAADGSNPTNLTNTPGFDAGPVWSPDGTKIAFHTERVGNSEVYIMNADGSDQTNLTNDPDMYDSSPAWSPDGSRIVYAKYEPGVEGDLWIMDPSGSNHENLTKSSFGLTSAPAWSPDGTQIAFAMWGPPSWNDDVWVIAADGSTAGPVAANSAASVGSPAWQKGVDAPPQPGYPACLTGEEIQLADAINATRVEHGLDRLPVDTRLVQTSRFNAEWFAHTGGGPDGYSRGYEYGYTQPGYIDWGGGFASAADFWAALVNDPTRTDLIDNYVLSPNLQHLGVGFYGGPTGYLVPGWGLVTGMSVEPAVLHGSCTP